MLFDQVTQVASATVTNFDIVSVKDFVKNM